MPDSIDPTEGNGTHEMPHSDPTPNDNPDLAEESSPGASRPTNYQPVGIDSPNDHTGCGRTLSSQRPTTEPARIGRRETAQKVGEGSSASSTEKVANGLDTNTLGRPVAEPSPIVRIDSFALC